ncbi:hypothetical protein S83_070331, partial [Arachis hypogaea]
YNLRSYIGGRRKGERERLLYRRVSKSCHYAIAYEIEQSTSFINVSPPPVVSVLKWEDVEIEESKEGKVAKLMTVKDVVLKLNPLFTKNKLLVSVAAGVKLHDLQDDNDSEELEDMIINPTNSVIVCARIEDDLSLLE